MNIGDRVKRAREAAELSLAELARTIGVSRSAIGQIENGMTKSPTAENLYKIACKTKTNLDWLITGKGGMAKDVLLQLDIAATGASSMSKDEGDLIEVYRKLSPSAKSRLLNAAKALRYDELGEPEEIPTVKRA